MMFALGYVAGLVTAVLIGVLLAYFKSPIVATADRIQKIISAHGLKQKGFVFMPEDGAAEARNKVIAENAKKGVDTRISELL